MAQCCPPGAAFDYSEANPRVGSSRQPYGEVYGCNGSVKQGQLTSGHSSGKNVTFGDQPPPAPGNFEAQQEPMLPDNETQASCNSDKLEPTLQGNTGADIGISMAGYRTGKYTPGEWHQNNYNHYYAAFADRDSADRIEHESRNLAAETEARTNRTQDENTKRLVQRCNDIHFWKVELEREIKDIMDETDRLVKQKNRLENALYATEVPLHIATECLNNRARRQATDLVQDDVECALLKEVEVINNVQDLLRKAISESDKQIEANRAKKQELEMDWSDKKEALAWEQGNARLRNEDTNKQFYPGAARLQEKMSNPESWAQFSHDNVCRAENERMASIQLRALIDNMLEDTSRDMREAADVVDLTLQKRTAEVEEAKQKLSEQLKKVSEGIANQEKNIEMLKAAIKAKEAPLKVAQTRLRTRNCGRPGVELCADDPQFGLINEVEEINSTLDALMHKLGEAENNKKDLYDNRMSLEKEIAVKTNSLFIDRSKCIATRSRYPSTVRLQGYNH